MSIERCRLTLLSTERATNMKRTMLAGTIMALGAVMLTAPGTARADPSISIGVSESAGTPTLIYSGQNSVGGVFFTEDFAGTVQATGFPLLPQPTLDSNSIDVQTTGTTHDKLYVYVTQSGLTSPLGVSNFLSSFTSNLFTANTVSLTENTFISADNAMWSGTLMASQTFTANGLGDGDSTFTSPSFTGPFSETTEFIVESNSPGSSVNGTINISDVPEPASLAVLGIGFAGILISRRSGFAASLTAAA